MRSAVAAVLLLTGCGGGAPADPSAQPPSVAGPPAALVGELLINTGPQPCDGRLREATWRNPGPARRIAELRLWVGASFGIRADIALGTYRISDGSLLIPAGGVDRYADPRSFQDQFLTQSYAPNFVVILAGDGIVQRCACTLVQPLDGAQVHVALSAQEAS